MFTGIITHLGRLKAVKQNRYTFWIEKSLIRRLKKGESIAINGVCLTIIDKEKNSFSVEVMPETLRKTNFEELKIGDYLNLELPVSVHNFFSGHLVQGHIDGVGIIDSIKKEGDSRIFKFKVKNNISKYLIEKGSIAVNGISLTVIKVDKNFFTVGIIPHTWRNTMLKYSKIGDKVNIEVDVIAKYVKKFLTKQLTTNHDEKG